MADLLQCLHEMLPEVRLEVPIRVAGKLYIACASVCERVRECVGERVADVGSARDAASGPPALGRCRVSGFGCMATRLGARERHRFEG